MATQRNPVRGQTAAGEAADQALVNMLRSTVHSKVIASLESVIGPAVDEAVNSAIFEASKIPGEDTPAPTVQRVTGHHSEITRPKDGGVCAAVWDELDRLRATAGAVPSLEDIRKAAKRRRWNANNARIEYYRWRAFNGITGRAQKAARGYKGPDRRRQVPAAQTNA